MLLTGHGLKIKTEPIVLPTLLIFFFRSAHKKWRCRAVWRRRRKAGTDEVKRNKNQSNPPKRKERKRKKHCRCATIFFSAGIFRLYSVPVFTQTHTYRAMVRGTRKEEEKKNRRFITRRDSWVQEMEGIFSAVVGEIASTSIKESSLDMHFSFLGLRFKRKSRKILPTSIFK